MASTRTWYRKLKKKVHEFFDDENNLDKVADNINDDNSVPMMTEGAYSASESSLGDTHLYVLQIFY